MTMTVKEMKDILSKYEDNEEVFIEGGSDEGFEFCIMYIGKDKIFEEG